MAVKEDLLTYEYEPLFRSEQKCLFMVYATHDYNKNSASFLILTTLTA